MTIARVCVALPRHLDRALRRHVADTGEMLSDVVRDALVAHIGPDRIEAERPPPAGDPLAELARILGAETGP